MKLGALVEEYIEETEDQGPEFSKEMVHRLIHADDKGREEIVWTEVQRFLRDFVTYVDVVANEDVDDDAGPIGGVKE